MFRSSHFHLRKDRVRSVRCKFPRHSRRVVAKRESAKREEGEGRKINEKRRLVALVVVRGEFSKSLPRYR